MVSRQDSALKRKEQFVGFTLYWKDTGGEPECTVESLLHCFCSDSDDRGCSCKGRGGPSVIVQVDHGVVGSAVAAKGSACAHLSVPQTLQVALRGKIQER